MTTIRMPQRVYSYITGTGWFQGQDDSEDASIMTALINGSRRNADGSLSIRVTEEWQLDYLAKEGGYALDSARWGDNTMDDLADANAARAFLRRIEAAR